MLLQALGPAFYPYHLILPSRHFWERGDYHDPHFTGEDIKAQKSLFNLISYLI
jgi:hypothetical protein